jgi:hypothetical protein
VVERDGKAGRIRRVTIGLRLRRRAIWGTMGMQSCPRP